MKSTNQQLLRNSDIEPTDDVISEALGEAYDAYVKFKKALADAYCLPINNEAKQMITELKRMGEKLRYFPIVFELHSEEQFETIYTLADFRKGIK